MAVIGVATLLLAPLWLVATVADGYEGSGPSGRAAPMVVGIGVILRATAQRLVQFGARGAFRTATSAVLRAITRTLTRRFSRMMLRTAAGTVTRHSLTRPSHLLPVIPRSRSVLSLGIGMAGLGASFFGSVLVSGDTTEMLMKEHFQISLVQMIFLSALPLLVYGGLIHLAGRAYAAQTRFATEPDGLLLQAYFTGGGSFLPMVTDMIIYGTPKQRGRVAMFALVGMYLCHLVLLAAAYLLGSGLAEFAASMFLIYAFIYCFPIHPMEGRAIWDDSRRRWCLLFVPILISFVLGFPAALMGVV